MRWTRFLRASADLNRPPVALPNPTSSSSSISSSISSISSSTTSSISSSSTVSIIPPSLSSPLPTWSHDEDSKLLELASSSFPSRPDFTAITTLHFPSKSPSDVFSRYTTFTVPHLLHTLRGSDPSGAKEMRRKGANRVINGHFCNVPMSERSETRFHRIPSYGRKPLPVDAVESVSNGEPSTRTVPVSSLDVVVQMASEKRKKVGKGGGREWRVEEDMVMREAMEVYGPVGQWDRIARVLKTGKCSVVERSPEECRKRMEEVCRGDWLVVKNAK